MRYGSVCSGIEAASVAWEPLGWEAQWFSEIEHFPSAVLNHRFPTVPNLGDMTKIHETETFNGKTIDLLVGGTPCQSFSVAGLRKGLADPRGNLMLTFLSLAERKKPRWIVWENVPGVLSSNGGRDFATFLTALGQLGYGFAYRVLDAQYFGVAQRRRRVFVVGYLGDWRPAGAVLFESESLSGDIKKSREKRKATSSDAQGGIGGGGKSTGVNPELMATLCAKDNEKWGCNQWVNEGKAIVEPIAFQQNTRDEVRYINGDGSIVGALSASSGMKQTNYLAQPIAIAENTIGRKPMNGGNGDGFTEDGPMYTLNATGVHGVAQPIPFRKTKRAQSKDDHESWVEDEKANTLNSFDTGDVRTTQAVVQPVAGFLPTQGSKANGIGYMEEQATTLRAGCDVYGVLQPIAFDTFNQTTSNVNQTIKSPQGGINESIGVIATPIAVDCYNQTVNEKTSQTIGSSASDVNHYGAVLQPIIENENYFEPNPFNDTFVHKGINHGRTQERDSVKVLSILREKIGTKAFAQWGLGVFNTLQSTQILQSDLHGIDVRPATFSNSRFIYGSLSLKENDSSWLLQSLRESGCEGCSPQGWELSEQLHRELGAYLSELPYEKPQSKRFLHDLWEADERLGLLRQALSKVQKIWRPTHGESKSTSHPYAIRRLTPFETEILQGFPRGWTKIPYRNKSADQCPDGPRYKACGNSMAVPVMRWIGERIEMVEKLMK